MKIDIVVSLTHINAALGAYIPSVEGTKTFHRKNPLEIAITAKLKDGYKACINDKPAMGFSIKATFGDMPLARIYIWGPALMMCRDFENGRFDSIRPIVFCLEVPGQQYETYFKPSTTAYHTADEVKDTTKTLQERLREQNEHQTSTIETPIVREVVAPNVPIHKRPIYNKAVSSHSPSDRPNSPGSDWDGVE